MAITSDACVANRLALQWGTMPHLEVPPEDLTEALRLSTSLLARERLCYPGDAFAMVIGWPLSGPTNMVKLHRM